ncbi:RNA methyltransferase [Candidatus Peregrinibacteria bacterium HGW-Peregrinibacteria-1]|jgi:tRNA G18 (ribose-2'-O)-methylase SpoU|nr:MAG: RNA methyltransferase [Candidatus Peregrinibacteria bacterium HGW-Peregrinibacteria-1]
MRRKLSFEEIQDRKPSVETVRDMARSPIFLILDNLRSLHNVGAIFRSADAVGVSKIFLCGMTGVPPRGEIAKTALGAEELVPFEYYENTMDAVKRMKKEGVEVVAVEITDDGELYCEANYKFPVCFVLGHEVQGVDDEVVKACDRAVYLPMKGRANSLNVATCAGIILYDSQRRI